jgi:putative endopeptidase
MKYSHRLIHLLFCLPAFTFAAATSGIDPSHFDAKVRFQDDLYHAANGGWQRRTAIPADKSAWGIDYELQEQSLGRVRELTERATQDNKDDPDAQRLSDLYASFMDEATIARRGLAPLDATLSEIAGLHDTTAVLAEFGRLQTFGVGGPLVLSVGVDAKDASHYALYLGQSGLGLPSRDYYLDKDARFVKARQAYLLYVQTLLELSGQTDASARARAIVALETCLAKAQWSETQNRDDQKTYNKLNRQQLAALAGRLPLPAMLGAAGVPAQLDTLIVQQPDYIRRLVTIVQQTPIAVWRDYLSVSLLDRFAPALPPAFADAHFALHEHELAGVEAVPPRWKLGVEIVNEYLGEAAGRLYVAKYFPPSAKARMAALVGNLMKAYGDSIDHLSWMSPATKARAHDKLAHYGVKIGYPDKWRDYSALDIKADDLIGNLMRGDAFEHARQFSRIGGLVDHSEWGMTPQTVNAYYDPTMNEIVFPAAILQPPYFDPEADDAANYGATGATIGHEISHGFDDQGSLYDASGNMRNWWQKADHHAFSTLTSRLVVQYNRYQPVLGRHVNGRLTLGENIADLSGLQIAYKAYHLSLGGQAGPTIDGFSADQRFFIAYAQSWNTKRREALTLQLLSTDPHSPEQFRANGAVENCDGFHEAFATHAGDGMYKPPAERIRIW